MHEVEASIERVMLENVGSDLVEHTQKTEEEVRVEKEKLLKTVEYFQTKVNTSQSMEE